jgi:hypothetical protein
MSNFLVGLDLNDVQVDTFSGNASTTAFTLSVAATTNGAAVHISGVRQVPTTDYSIAATTLTFTTAPPTGTNNVAVMYTKAAILNTPADASVTTSKIGDDQVTTAKMSGGTLDVGFDTTAVADGTKTTGTYTLVYTGGNMKTATNGGAHTLAPPASDGTIVVQYTNNASAGTITTSGFTLVDGDTISTTDGDDFFFYVTKCNGFSHLTVKALQ